MGQESALVAEYLTNGFVLRDLLDGAAVRSLAAVADTFATSASSMVSSSGDFNIEADGGGYLGQDGGSAGYRGLLRKVSNAASHSPVVREYSERPSMMAFVSELMQGAPCHLVHSVMWFKPPKVGSAKPPHQDAPYLKGDPNQYLTIWIAIDDSTSDNGCLEVVAGSHQYGPVLHEGQEARVSADRWATETSRPVPLSAGRAIAFHPYLLHASKPNRSSKSRRALTLRYVIDDSKAAIRDDC